MAERVSVWAEFGRIEPAKLEDDDALPENSDLVPLAEDQEENNLFEIPNFSSLKPKTASDNSLIESKVRSELNKFLQQERIQVKDAAGYWSEISTLEVFPNLARAYKSASNILGSSSVCEGTFSRARHILGIRRTHMGPDLLESLLMVGGGEGDEK